jgi:hypothetical protein
MRSPEGAVSINQTKYIDRFRVTVEPLTAKKKTVGGSVATHEARHAVAAVANGTEVRSATIVPGPGYLGLTELSRPDPISAAAPHATGSNGTGHDVFIIGLMGYDVSTASNVARGIIANNHKEVAAVAALLEEKRTVTGHEIQETMKNVSKKEERVMVIVEDADVGKIHIEEVQATKGVVVFDKKWVKEDVALAA